MLMFRAAFLLLPLPPLFAQRHAMFSAGGRHVCLRWYRMMLDATRRYMLLLFIG